MFYNCYDSSKDIMFTIREFKYLDGLDLLIKKLDDNLYQSKKQLGEFYNEAVLIDNYLRENPQGDIINLNGFKFVKVIDGFKNKFFFVDKSLAASFEIIIESQKVNKLSKVLDETILSVRAKKLKF